MNHRGEQRGVALIMCLFALMLLSGIGLGMIYMANTETAINRNYRDSQQAYFAANAGLQEARERLGPTSANPITPPSTLPGAGITTGVTYLLNWGSGWGPGVNKSDIQPWTAGTTFFDTEFCHESFVNTTTNTALVAATAVGQPCTAVPTSGGTPTYVDSTMPTLFSSHLSSNLPYRWVRITKKANNTAAPFSVASTTDNTRPICWDGTRQLPLPATYSACDVDPPPDGITYLKSVYVLTSLAVTSSGSRRLVQAEIANNPPLVTNAAVDTNNFVTVSGSSVTVNGFDNCKCSCVMGVGSAPPTCTNRVGGGACTGNTYAIYSSQTVTTSGNPAMVAGTTQPGCTLPACNPAVAQNQPFPYDVNSLISQYTSRSDVVNTSNPSGPYNIPCTPHTPYPDCGNLQNGVLGTLPSPFPPTDPTNPVGAVNQITYVPGSFDIRANTTGAGVLIVDGDLTLHAGLNFYGTIIVRGVLTYSGSGNGQDLNILGGVIAGQGSVADALSGGINIQYDRCAQLHNVMPQPPRLLSTHESMY